MKLNPSHQQCSVLTWEERWSLPVCTLWFLAAADGWRWLSHLGKGPLQPRTFSTLLEAPSRAKCSIGCSFFFDLRGRGTVFWITQLCRRSGFFPPFCWRLCFLPSSFPGTDPVQHKPTSKGFGFPESGSPLFVRFIHCPTERCHTTSSGISLGASHLKPIQWKPIYFIWHRLSDHEFCYGKQNIFRFCKTNN